VEDLQVACIERDNAQHLETIVEARTMNFVSQGQITRDRRFNGVDRDEKEREQDAAFESNKWAKQPYNTHGYKAIEIAVFEVIKKITAKHYQHLCMGVSVDHEDCDCQTLEYLDTNLKYLRHHQD